MHVRTYVCMYVRMYVHMYIRMYVRMYVFMYVYACMYARIMYVHMCDPKIQIYHLLMMYTEDGKFSVLKNL